MNDRPELRIGDAERAAAASALGEHFASGRLTREEYDERSGQVWSARTNSDLRPLFVDLPSPQVANRRPATSRAVSRQGSRHDNQDSWRSRHLRGVPFLPVLLIAIALVIWLPGPPWPLFVLAWLWLAGCFHGGWSHRR